jgi:hypothetical protein
LGEVRVRDTGATFDIAEAPSAVLTGTAQDLTDVRLAGRWGLRRAGLVRFVGFAFLSLPRAILPHGRWYADIRGHHR